jgi:hypothetical protein
MSTADEPEFYLDGLLWCHTPMWSIQRRSGRCYRCLFCNTAIDATTAEVDVWLAATQERPDLGFWGTPYEQRRNKLLGRLRWVRIMADGSYTLRWSNTKPWPTN